MEGVVTDTNLVPLRGATVSLLGSSVSATTGDNGRFRIVALPVGEYVVMARRLGFASASVALSLDVGDTLRPAFALRPVTPMLDTVRASAIFAVTRLGEFEDRRAHSIGGHFITADEIYTRNPTGIGDMLASVPSLAVSGPFGNQTVSPMRVGSLNQRCAIQIFVDGMLFDEMGRLSNVPTPSEIAGVEIYSGPTTIPLQYKRASSGCGIILIWTKSGT